MTIELTDGTDVVQTPDYTMRELARLVEFNAHLRPFETLPVNVGLLRRVHEGLTELVALARDAHHSLEHAAEDIELLGSTLEAEVMLREDAEEWRDVYRADRDMLTGAT